MSREAKFVKLIHFSDGTVAAEFKHATPCFRYEESYCGRGRAVIETHFCLNLPSLKIRIANLKLPINYGKIPWTLVEERKALAALAA